MLTKTVKLRKLLKRKIGAEHRKNVQLKSKLCSFIFFFVVVNVAPYESTLLVDLYMTLIKENLFDITPLLTMKSDFEMYIRVGE